MRTTLSLLLIAVASAVFLTIGTVLMNYTLVEFIGAGAPQPSILGWTVVWVSVFIIRNVDLNISIDRLKAWITGDPTTYPELEEIRALRQEIRTSILEAYDEDYPDSGTAS